MGRVLIFAVTISAALLAVSQQAHSDSTSVESSAGSMEGSSRFTPPDPFAAPDPGPTSALWHHDSLTPAEQAYIAHAGQASNDEDVNAAYASATSELAETAKHEAAAEQLGVEGLAKEGVVP